MTKPKKKILFFTPYATRTGSEMMLYYILKHLDRSRFEAGLVCFAKGELIKDLPSDIPVFLAPRNFTFADKVAYHLGFHPTTQALRKISKQFKADVWYVNTAMLSDVIKVAHELGMPVISHIHELSAMYSQISGSDFMTIVNHSDMVIGCSETVCRCMRESGAVNVRNLYSFIDLGEINPDPVTVKSIRDGWGVKPGERVWLMSGTTSERKGFDLLPDIAAQIPAGAGIHLVWVGNLSNDGLVYWTSQRCKQIEHVQIHLIGARKEDYYSYIDAADGFMFTSRQEPFGLVMVEAAWLGKPIVSFNSGGPSEFITPEFGTIIPNLDITLFARTITSWDHGKPSVPLEETRQKLLEYSTETKIAEWHQIIEDFLQ